MGLEYRGELQLLPKSALEGERKRVTVLFADVRGSLTLAEQVDAEEWHAVLDRFPDFASRPAARRCTMPQLPGTHRAAVQPGPRQSTQRVIANWPR